MGFPMSYSTAYRWSGNGVVGASSMGTYPPVAVGQPDGGDHTDPEQLFVSAAETCLANTFFFSPGQRACGSSPTTRLRRVCSRRLRRAGFVLWRS